MPFPLIFWATNLHFSSTYKLSTWIPLCNLKLYTEDSFIYHSVTDGIFYFQKHVRNWLLCLLTESSNSWNNKEVVSKSFTVKTCNSNKIKQEFRTWIYITIFTGWQENAQILRFTCLICPYLDTLTTFLKTSIAKNIFKVISYQEFIMIWFSWHLFTFLTSKSPHKEKKEEWRFKF